MKNKGFTLMELLAVIVILAIIALIATPIILGIIDDTKEDANERSVELYASSIKTAVAKYQMVNNKPLSGNFTTTDGKTLKQGEDIELEVEYNGGSVICNNIIITNDGEVNLENCKVNNNGDYSYTNGKVSKNEDAPDVDETSSVCTLADANNNNKADRSELVTCTSGNISERFYVVETVSGNVNMLSEYNITLSTTNPLQDKTDTTYPAKNSVDFLDAFPPYWLDEDSGEIIVDSEYEKEEREYPYIYNSNSKIYEYINAYKDVLEGMGVNVIEAKLMSYEQMIKLGCSEDFCTSAPFWVYLTSYWLGSLSNTTDVWSVDVDGYYTYSFSFETLEYGIRPLIVISEDDLG